MKQNLSEAPQTPISNEGLLWK